MQPILRRGVLLVQGRALSLRPVLPDLDFVAQKFREEVAATFLSMHPRISTRAE